MAAEKTVSLSEFKGLNNVLPEDRIKPNELTEATNLNIDESGKISSRAGFALTASTTSAHSLTAVSNKLIYVDGTSLMQSLDGITSTVLRTGLTPGAKMRYADLVGRLYMTNGKQTGVVDSLGSRSLGLDIPALPTAATTSGELPAGRYSYSMTYVRSDGQESGAPRSGTIEISAGQGISFTNLPVSSDSGVVGKRIYVSSAGGEELFLTHSLAAGTTSAVYRGYRQGIVPLITMHKGPPPAGTALAFFNGRLYIAQGNVLWFTDLYNYELVDYRKNFVQFEDAIQTVAAVDDGLFVGTSTQTYFLRGKAAGELEQVAVANYGTIAGSEVTINGYRLGKDGTQGLTKGWVSTNGLCVGVSGGEVINLSNNTYNISSAKFGASLYKDKPIPQVVISLFN